jgi:hypothetical protein
MSWNPLGHTGPLMGLLYLNTGIHCFMSFCCNHSCIVMAPLWVQQMLSHLPITIISQLSLLIFSLLLAVLPLAFLHFPCLHTVSFYYPCPAHYSTHRTTPYTLLVHLKTIIQPTLSQYNATNFPSYLLLTRGGVVIWGTALQSGRSWLWFPMVSLEFFIDIILPAALWPWGWLSL